MWSTIDGIISQAVDWRSRLNDCEVWVTLDDTGINKPFARPLNAPDGDHLRPINDIPKLAEDKSEG